ncbi:MAG: hypothetical protein NT133_03600 [Alphaproteobacteria bacterium]|nr:hypothetical protein [Alphaproteobacteria bacterium]
MPNPRSAELRQQRRQVITETIILSRQQRAGSPAPRSILRGIRRPDVERLPALSDIRPTNAWGMN